MFTVFPGNIPTIGLEVLVVGQREFTLSPLYSIENLYEVMLPPKKSLSILVFLVSLMTFFFICRNIDEDTYVDKRL